MIDRTVEYNTFRQQYDMLNYEMRNVDNSTGSARIAYRAEKGSVSRLYWGAALNPIWSKLLFF